ncbi:MAG: 30S ribosomal protein S4 [Candidatus Aminicenantales bacterium]
MSRYRGPVCRLCRVEKTKLFLKGNKCLTDRCPVERRPYPPGERGRMRRRILGYGIQLREKQKLKRYYMMTEEQFHLFFERAERKRGITGENLLVMLERRLDSVVFMLGFAHSRAHARQLVTHGHIRVNGSKVDIPSYLVKKGDTIEFRERTLGYEYIKALLEANKDKEIPGWLEVNWDEYRGKVVALPTAQDIVLPVEEHLVVELYSK